MISYSTLTNVGSRNVNEDSIGVFEKGENKCFLVCDGLGGHGMGDAASSVVKDVFKNLFESCDDAASFLPRAFTAAQDVLMSEQKVRNATEKMKTTAVCAVTNSTTAYIGHVGDSRLYIFKNDKVKKRTLDHSVPQMLVVSKEIKESEIRNHPDRNMLLNVMGIEWDEPMYELAKPIALKKCQAFLLCSDGFWELIEESDMCALLKKSASVNEWLFEMAEIVKKNGAGRNMDNYSAIAVWNN